MILRNGAVWPALLCLVAAVSPGFEAADPPEEATAEGRVWLGVLIDDDSADGGVEVVAVIPGGPADEAGLMPGDVLINAAGRAIVQPRDLELFLSDTDPGVRVPLLILRTGRTVEREIRLRARDDRTTAALEMLPPRPGTAPRPPLPPTPLGFPGVSSYGFTVADVTPDLRVHYGAPADAGVLVTVVQAGRPADVSGLRVGDVLVSVGRREVRRPEDVARALARSADDVCEVTVVRKSRPEVVRLVAPRDSGATPPASVAATVSDDALRLRIEAEIERLQRRIVQLQQQLESLER